MAPSVGVRDGQRCVPDGVGVVRFWANRGECDVEVAQDLCEQCTRVSDGDGDELYLPLILLENRDERGVLFGLLCVFLVASEVMRESDLYENEGA